MMTLEQLCATNDISMYSAATALANLIEKGLVTSANETQEEDVARLRAVAEAHRPGVVH